VTDINGLFPSAGTMNIAVGAGLTISNSGNTITLDSAGASGTPGFELAVSGTFTLISSETQPGYTEPDMDFHSYVSGTSPNQICTLQTQASTIATSGGNTFILTTNILSFIPTECQPKYNQGGVISGFNITNNLPFMCTYNLDTAGLLSLNINTISLLVATGDTYYMNGLSLVFPIVPIPPLPFDMLFQSETIATTVLPATQPTTTQTLTLTQPAYVGAPIVYNIASNFFAGGNCPTVALGATTQTEVSQFGGVGGSLFTQYTFGTTTQTAQVDLQTATGINDLYTLAMCCPATNDKCYALMFSATNNAHYIVDVFSSPLVDLNLSIPGPSLVVNSMSCEATTLVLCYVPNAPPNISVFSVYTLVASPSSITFSANDTASPLTGSEQASFSLLYNGLIVYSFNGANGFRSIPANAISGAITSYPLPSGYYITRCIGNDPYGNVLVAGFPSGPGPHPYTIFAYSITTQALIYEIAGNWSSFTPLIAR